MNLSRHHRAVAADLRRQRALIDLLDHLSAARIRALVIKGAALAYTLYEAPTERERHDADLLVPHSQIEQADHVLRTIGYAREAEPDLMVASGQRHYRPPSPWMDPIDLHWRVANPQVFERVLPFEEAWSRSVPVVALGPHARSLAPTDALLLACVHRVAHHANADDRRWLDDIDRLVRQFDQEDADAFVEAASKSGIRAVCTCSLQLAAIRCGTPSSTLIDALRPDSQAREASAVFAESAPHLAGILASDLRHASWRTRALLLRDHLFPALDYMRARYPRWPRALLVFAYPMRIAVGVPAWFRKTSSTIN